MAQMHLTLRLIGPLGKSVLPKCKAASAHVLPFASSRVSAHVHAYVRALLCFDGIHMFVVSSCYQLSTGP